MKVKVCGMRDADNIREVEALGIDMMGFIFWPKSSRYVSERPEYLPIYCKRVGVFVDASIGDIRQHVADYALDIIQLHGSESPDYIRQLKAVATPRPSRGGVAEGRGGVSIIKAFNIATSADLEATKPYEGIVDYFLFDTKGPSVGGNGAKFDWTVLADYVGETPFLLSGGIGPDDAARIRRFHHPQLAGIDLNSQFEITPGLKDINKLKEFIKELQL